MRYYENDEFTIPKRYQKMTVEQLDRRCRMYEMFHKFILKFRRSSKSDKIKDIGIKFNL